MVWLLLSVVCSVILGVLFKLFPRYGIDTFQAIVANYFTCVMCSTVHNGKIVLRKEIVDLPWFWYAILLGFVFISGFTLAAATVRNFSVTISQIMQKMSILISVPFAMLAYNESAGWLKVIGIIFAVLAIVLVNIPPTTADSGRPFPYKMLAIPFFTWLLAGVIEVVFVRVQKEGMISFGDSAFITTVFATAGVVGLTYFIWQMACGQAKFGFRNLFAGILLGIPNYGSMYFLLQGLSSGMESSVFFPLNNMGIILLTVLIAVFLFKDKLTIINLIGISLTILALYCLNG